MNIQALDLCPLPWLLKRSRGAGAQGRVEALVPGDLVENTADRPHGICIVHLRRQVHLFLLQRAHEALRVAILPGRTHLRHADLHATGRQLEQLP